MTKPLASPLILHPGEILRDEFLEPHGVTQYRLAKELGIHETRVSDIVLGKRSITADTALRLAAFFETSPEFWLNLQTAYDLEEERRRLPTPAAEGEADTLVVA